MTKPALHFVGFKDDRYWNAVKVFGVPDFYHRIFDQRAKQDRARQAESNSGVDWKALSHAVRVARQAIELLETGFVIFPRPEAEHLTAIKIGSLPYQKVAEEIDDLLPAVEEAAARSTLPEIADTAWIDDFVAATYRAAIGTTV